MHSWVGRRSLVPHSAQQQVARQGLGLPKGLRAGALCAAVTAGSCHSEHVCREASDEGGVTRPLSSLVFVKADLGPPKIPLL